MLHRLKITVHNIVPTPPSIPKGPLDYYLYILTYTIGLDYLFISLLLRRTKDLFPPFTPPLLHTILVTPDH
jgi:hypothetical protein